MKNKMATSHGSQSPPSIGRPVDRVFEDAQSTGEIILHGRKLRDFPKICAKFDLNDTIHVDISRNRLSDFPAEICDYMYVERINCYDNVIRTIPDAISQLQVLTHLNLSRNQLTVLSPALCMLRSLEVLSASNNKLVSLPEEIGQLEHLMDLDVSCNEISHLPLQIGDLSSLRNLNLRRNFLVELPVEISRLHLYRLDFSSNRIEKIPPGFRKMETLQQLIHDNNPLSSPPAYICSKGKQHIMKYLQIEAIKEDRKRGIMVNNDSDIKRYVRKSLPPQQPSEDFHHMLGAPESKWKRHTILSNDSGYSTSEGEKNGWASGENAAYEMNSDNKAIRPHGNNGHFSFPNPSSQNGKVPLPYHHDNHRQNSNNSTDSQPVPLVKLRDTSHRHQSSSSSSSTLSPGPKDYGNSLSPTSPQPSTFPFPQSNYSNSSHTHVQQNPPNAHYVQHYQSSAHLDLSPQLASYSHQVNSLLISPGPNMETSAVVSQAASASPSLMYKDDPSSFNQGQRSRSSSRNMTQNAASSDNHSRQQSKNSLVDYSKPRSDSPSLSGQYYFDQSNQDHSGHFYASPSRQPSAHGHAVHPASQAEPQWPHDSRAQLLKAPSSSSLLSSESTVSPPLPPHVPMQRSEGRRAPLYQMDEDLEFRDDDLPVVMTGNMEDEFTRELRRQKADYERRKKQAEEIRLKQQIDEEEREKEDRRLAAIKLMEEQKLQDELRRQEEARKLEVVKKQKIEEQRLLEERMREEEEAQMREEELKRLHESALIQEAKERERERSAAEELRKASELKAAEDAKKNKLSNNYYTQLNQHHTYANARGLPPKPPSSLPVHGMASQIPVSQRESPQVEKDYIMSESEYRNALSSQSFKEQRRLANNTQYRRAASDSLNKKSTPSPSSQVEALNHINRNGVADGSRLSSASTTPSVSPSPSPSSSVSHLAKPVAGTNHSPGGAPSLLAKPGSSSSISQSGSHSQLAKPSSSPGGSSFAKVGAATKSGVPRANGAASATGQAVRRTKMSGDRSNTSSPVTARSTRTAGTTGIRSQSGSITPGCGSNLRRSSNSSTTDEETKSSKPPNSSVAPSRLKSRLEEQKQRNMAHTPAVRKLATPDNDNKRINIKAPTNTYSSNRTRHGLNKSLEDSAPNHTLRRKEEQQREEAEQMDRLRQTVETRLKVTLPDNIAEALRDGVVLCHLANQIRPRSVGSIHVPSPAVPKLTLAKCRRNVDNFLEACRKIGVGPEQICGPQDILEEKAISRVAITVAALVAIGTNPKQSVV